MLTWNVGITIIKCMVPIKISFKKLRYCSMLIKEVVTCCYYLVTHNNLENIFMCVCVLRMCMKVRVYSLGCHPLLPYWDGSPVTASYGAIEGALELQVHAAHLTFTEDMGIQTQVLMPAWQALYLLSCCPSPQTFWKYLPVLDFISMPMSFPIPFSLAYVNYIK